MLRHIILVVIFAVSGRVLPLFAETPGPTIHTVEIQGHSFIPDRIEAKIGDVIQWTNRDSAPHSANGDAGDWGTGKLRNGVSGTFTVIASGNLTYHCKYHPHMKAVIVVK